MNTIACAPMDWNEAYIESGAEEAGLTFEQFVADTTALEESMNVRYKEEGETIPPDFVDRHGHIVRCPKCHNAPYCTCPNPGAKEDDEQEAEEVWYESGAYHDMTFDDYYENIWKGETTPIAEYLEQQRYRNYIASDASDLLSFEEYKAAVDAEYREDAMNRFDRDVLAYLDSHDDEGNPICSKCGENPCTCASTTDPDDGRCPTPRCTNHADPIIGECWSCYNGLTPAQIEWEDARVEANIFDNTMRWATNPPLCTWRKQTMNALDYSALLAYRRDIIGEYDHPF